MPNLSEPTLAYSEDCPHASAPQRHLQEVENIGPGPTRELRVELPAGTYEGTCKPGMIGDGIRTDIEVSGEQAEPLSEDQALTAAAESSYRYVGGQSRAPIAQTEQFVAAVKAGDVEKAKALSPVARTPWERIEPVAEIFGGLDPAIDARVNDIAEGDERTGYHRIERQLWVEGNTAGMDQYADKLLADVRKVVRPADRHRRGLRPGRCAAGRAAHRRRLRALHRPQPGRDPAVRRRGRGGQRVGQPGGRRGRGSVEAPQWPSFPPAGRPAAGSAAPGCSGRPGPAPWNAAGAGGYALRGDTAATATPSAVEAVPFEGRHQAGIVTPAQDRLHVARYDVPPTTATISSPC